MESCPKADIPNLKQLLCEENLYLTTEVSKFSFSFLKMSLLMKKSATDCFPDSKLGRRAREIACAHLEYETKHPFEKAGCCFSA